MEFNRCYGCMRELPTPGGVCPVCGYDNTEGPKAQPAHTLPCGAVLAGRYLVGRVLGQGGFGVTYAGFNLALALPVCIKEYFPDGAAMRSATQSQRVYWGASDNAARLRRGRESFVKEAQKAVRLMDLDAIVKVWDVFYENETAYIIMNYVEGRTLKSHILAQGYPITEKECLALLRPVMGDLEKAHARGIVHRDIKPDNLMLTPDGRLVLLDLGAAKDLKAGSGQSSFLVASQGFSPLEQYKTNGQIGPWTDVYAVCATICWCVSGRLLPPPIERMERDELDLSGFSPAVAAALKKGLAIRGEDRIRSMGELTAAFERPPAELRSESEYARARALMEQGDEQALRAAESIFTALGAHKDARKLAAECRERIQEGLRRRQEEERRAQEAARRKAEEAERRSREEAARLNREASRRGAGAGKQPPPAPAGDGTQAAAQKKKKGKGVLISLAGSILLAILISLAGGSGKNSSQNAIAVPTFTLTPPSATPALVSVDPRKMLTGAWGEPEPIHNGLSPAFYLDRAVTDCRGLTMTLSIEEYTGYPFGNWYLYARGLDGNWHDVATFKLDKSMGDGHSEGYAFYFDAPESFEALALCIRDKGNEYTISWGKVGFAPLT